MVDDAQDVPFLLTLLRRWWWLILLSILLSAGASYAITKRIKPTYEASARLYLDTASVSSSIGSYTDRNSSLMLASAVATMINSYRVAERAASTFHLGLAPAQLLKEINATSAADAPIVTIQVDDGQRTRVATLANAVAATIIAVNRDDQSVRFSSLEKATQAQIASTTRAISGETAQLHALTRSGDSSPATTAQVNAVSQQLYALQNYLSTVKAQLNSILLSQAQSATTLTVIDSARAPTAAISPDTRKNVLLGLALGLLLSLAVIAAIHYLDDPLSAPDVLESRLDVPVLATVSRRPSAGKQLLARGDRPDHGAEGYTLLHAAVSSRRSDHPIRSLLMASGGPGEGASSVAANYAVAAAQAGRKVVLIDANLRRPDLHDLFGLDQSPGLSDVLLGAEEVLTVTRATATTGLSVVCSGQEPPNPAALLSSGRMVAVIRAASEAADLVVVDGPPALLFSDASVLARQVDAALVVLDQERSSMRSAGRTLRMLQLVGATVLGLVINRPGGRVGGYDTGPYRPANRSPEADATGAEPIRSANTAPMRAEAIERPSWNVKPEH